MFFFFQERARHVILSAAKRREGPADHHLRALYQHQSTLRTILEGLGVTVFPGAAASAPAMFEFFNP